jgi:acid stress-induced BolA-like protein IbaG/YrbA
LRVYEAWFMIEKMLDENRLRAILSKVQGATDVVVVREGSKFIAVVVSPAFAGKEEHERQSEVWTLLLDALSDDDQAQVGFVFTNTPEEREQAQPQGA